MSKQLTVPIRDVMRAVSILVEHVAEQYGENVPVEVDYFWSINPKEQYNPYETPEDLTIGQIVECMQWVENVVGQPADVVNYSLVWVAEILRALGHLQEQRKRSVE